MTPEWEADYEKAKKNVVEANKALRKAWDEENQRMLILLTVYNEYPSIFPHPPSLESAALRTARQHLKAASEIYIKMRSEKLEAIVDNALSSGTSEATQGTPQGSCEAREQNAQG